MRIDHNKFKEHTESIENYMSELYLGTVIGSFPTDRQIAILGKMFYERDKDVDKTFDAEMSHVIRGFEWGMKAFRQIMEEGNNY